MRREWPGGDRLPASKGQPSSGGPSPPQPTRFNQLAVTAGEGLSDSRRPGRRADARRRPWTRCSRWRCPTSWRSPQPARFRAPARPKPLVYSPAIERPRRSSARPTSSRSCHTVGTRVSSISCSLQKRAASTACLRTRLAGITTYTATDQINKLKGHTGQPPAASEPLVFLPRLEQLPLVGVDPARRLDADPPDVTHPAPERR